MTTELPQRIGGTDLGKLLGISRHGNAANVFERCWGLEEESWSPQKDRGQAMEPVLRAHGQNALGITIEKTTSDYHDHPTRDFARAQIDDLATLKGQSVVVDYKSQSRWAKGWGKAGGDEIPESIHAQVAWEMACADRDMAVLVVGFGDDLPAPEIFQISHVCVYRVERDPFFESYCLTVAETFWRTHVIPRVPPAMKPKGKKRKSK